jgi:outer membrane protein
VNLAKWSAGAALACAAGLSGCRATSETVRRARDVQDPASRVAGERTPTAEELGLPRTGAVSLDALLRAAMTAHPSVLGARRDAEAAEARVRQAEAATASVWPTVSVNGSAGLRDQRRDTRTPLNNRFASFGFDVSWLLYDFGRTDAFARNAAEQWLAAQAALRTAITDVAFGVRSSYHELAQRIELLAVAEETVRQFQARLDQVREQARVGERIQYDVTKAEVDLADARLAEVRARDAVLTAQANLANAVGLAELVEWTPAASGRPSAAAPAFDDLWKEAQTQRPSLAAAAARERGASALVDADVADLYPTITFGAGASEGGTRFPWTWSANVGPSIRWVPFDRWANLATIDEQVAVLRVTRAGRAAEEQRAWLEVRSAWIAIEDARSRFEVTALGLRSAQENLELAQGRFEVGLGTSIELTDAQQALTKARSEDVQARGDYDIAVARLKQAIGEEPPHADLAVHGAPPEEGR